MNEGELVSIEYFNASVKNAIEDWPDDILAHYARILELLKKFGPHMGMPHSRAMGNGIFELRPHGREGGGRAFYCFAIDHRIVILHAFIKKTHETPRKELITAMKRMREVHNG